MIRVLSLLASVSVLVGCEKKRTPDRYLIPANYEGVVITVFDQPGFPPLPIEDGFRLHGYPDDGILITSSSQELGWAADETLDVAESGARTPIPTRHSGGRCERFGGTGSQMVDGLPPIDYYFKAIGGDAYWMDRDAKEYDKKAEEAMRKLQRFRK